MNKQKYLEKSYTEKRPFLEQHVGERIRERYGIDLRQGEYDEIVQLVLDQKAVLLEKQKNGRSKYVVDFLGEQLPLIFDHTYNLIVTILPPHILIEFGRYMQ